MITAQPDWLYDNLASFPVSTLSFFPLQSPCEKRLGVETRNEAMTTQLELVLDQGGTKLTVHSQDCGR